MPSFSPKSKRVLCCAILLMCVSSIAPAERMLLQVEDFQGPWRRQTNIGGYIGDGFCTSNANPEVASEPMATTVTCESPRTWRVWVRAWTSPGDARALQVHVAGVPLAVTHKDETRCWSWQLAGIARLPEGPACVAVHDADVGFESADAVLLTTDPEEDPMQEELDWAVYAEKKPARADALAYTIRRSMEFNRSRTPPPALDVWEESRDDLLLELRRSMGLDPWPEKTPLEATITSTTLRDGYRIENLVFQSRPRFYVPANVYVPTEGEAPFPAVVMAMGHNMQESKNYELYQSCQIGLVKQGFVVLAYDPVGQGERRLPGFSHQVNYLAFTLGLTLEGFMAWDTIRAIDYLETRDDVDASRIGLTGNSGGGLNTLYTAPIEPRIAAAASNCCTCEYEAWVERGGNHCVCNHQIGLFRHLEEFELVGLCAPRAYMAGNAIADPIFPIDGVRRTIERAREIYALYDAPERTGLTEVPGGHGFGQELREATYGWFAQFLQDAPDSSPRPEPELDLFPWDAPEVQCFENGMPEDAETFLSIVKAEADRLVAEYPALPSEPPAMRWWADHLREQVARAIDLAGPAAEFAPVLRDAGTVTHHGIGHQRLIIETEPDFEIPGVLLLPDEPAQTPQPVVLYVDGRGKHTAMYDETVQQILAKGAAVLALDVRAMGEIDTPDNQTASDAIMLGRSVVAQQAWDLMAAARAIGGHPEIDETRMGLMARGAAGIPATLAAGLSDDLGPVALIDTMAAYLCAFQDPPALPYTAFAGNILKHADLPHLLAAGAPRPLLVVNPLGDGAEPVGEEEALRLLETTRTAYERVEAMNAFRVHAGAEKPAEAIAPFFLEALSR